MLEPFTHEMSAAPPGTASRCTTCRRRPGQKRERKKKEKRVSGEKRKRKKKKEREKRKGKKIRSEGQRRRRFSYRNIERSTGVRQTQGKKNKESNCRTTMMQHRCDDDDDDDDKAKKRCAANVRCVVHKNFVSHFSPQALLPWSI
jgi:hypothetical protein